MNVDDEETETQYATAVEVYGIRRTLDQFMKRQEENNSMMKAKLDKLLLHFCNSSLNRETPEGKGSNFKGKRIQQPHTSYAHKSHYIGQSSQFAQQQLYRPPPMTRAQYMY